MLNTGAVNAPVVLLTDAPPPKPARVAAILFVLSVTFRLVAKSCDPLTASLEFTPIVPEATLRSATAVEAPTPPNVAAV